MQFIHYGVELCQISAPYRQKTNSNGCSCLLLTIVSPTLTVITQHCKEPSLSPYICKYCA